MTRRTTARIISLLATVALMPGTSSLLAHHGTNISYDRSQQWTKEVVVTRFEYKNPHPQLYFQMKTDTGAAEEWGAELLPNPAQLIRNGWSRQRSMDALKPGTVINVTVAPSKAGGTVGLCLKMTSPTGEEIVTGGGGPGGTQADPDARRPPPPRGGADSSR